VVGYGPFSLCVIHEEGLCPSSEADGEAIQLTNHTYSPATGHGVNEKHLKLMYSKYEKIKKLYFENP
jgi:hypothetical protein